MAQAASVQVGSKAFFFTATDSNANRNALELDLGTYAMRAVGPSTFLLFDSYPSAVTDGNLVYIIGGYKVRDSGNVVVVTGFYQFNPNTFENKHISVTNFPTGGYSYVMAPGLVFVPGKNRIYAFGGESKVDRFGTRVHDGIFYFDLSSEINNIPMPATLNSDINNCNEVTEG